MALEGFKVKRNADGTLAPRSGVTPTLGLEIVVLPLTYGQTVSYDSFGHPVKNWTREEKARLLTENLVSVEGETAGDVTPEDIDEFEAYSLSDILEGLILLSALNKLYSREEESGNVGAPVPEE